MAERIELWPIEQLVPYTRNARTHSPDQIAQIVSSMSEFGFTNPILVDGDSGIIAGHGRLEAAKVLNLSKVPVIQLGHLTEEQKRAYVIADNKIALNAGWDLDALNFEIGALRDLDFNIDVIGFSNEELLNISDGFLNENYQSEFKGDGEYEGDDGTRTEEEEEEENEKSDGSLLALVDITIGEPKHQPESGDVWKVGEHLLFVCSVMTDWAKWAPELNGDDVVFAPYPGPFVPLGVKADDHKLVMVQPDKYNAGHLLDRYAEIHGKKSVKRVASKSEEAK